MANIKEIRDYIDKSNTKLLSEIRKEVTGVHEDLSNKITQMSADFDKKVSCVIEESTKQGDRINALEDRFIRFDRRNEILIRNIPILKDENLYDIFMNIAQVVNFATENIIFQIYRLPVKNQNTNYSQSSEGARHVKERLRSNKVGETSQSQRTKAISPPGILVKFAAPWIKSMFMNHYFKYNSLNLTDIGFSASSRIYISDNLTTRNHHIFREASTLKKSGIISKIRTADGLIYINLGSNSSDVLVSSTSELMTLVKKSPN